MSQPHDFTPEEADLARQLRALPAGEPGPELDARILASARNAVRRSPRQRPWFWGLATAASAVIAVGLMLRLQHEGIGPEQDSTTRMQAAPPASKAERAEALRDAEAEPFESKETDRARQALSAEPDADVMAPPAATEAGPNRESVPLRQAAPMTEPAAIPTPAPVPAPPPPPPPATFVPEPMPPAPAVPALDDDARLDRIEVTGSRVLPRTESAAAAASATEDAATAPPSVELRKRSALGEDQSTREYESATAAPSEAHAARLAPPQAPSLPAAPLQAASETSGVVRTTQEEEVTNASPAIDTLDEAVRFDEPTGDAEREQAGPARENEAVPTLRVGESAEAPISEAATAALNRIRALLAQGEHEAAREALQRWRHDWPDATVPKDLEALLE